MSEQQEEKTNETAKSEHINVKVVNAEGNEVFFKIKKSTPLRKLMEAYCKRQGFTLGTVRFSFDGNRISDEQTAEEVN
jgi:small ubiquitin-related modifier